MRKLVIALIAVLCFIFSAFPALASDVEASKEVSWKQAYRELIISDAASISTEMKERTSYHLISVSDNSAPMMYISYGDYASGGRICYYNEGGLHSEQTPDLYIAYVEGSNMMVWFWGHMGYYYEAVEQWDGKDLTALGTGEYGASNGVLVDEDNGETAINSYIWEGKEVSREDYRALRLALWDKMVETEGEVKYTGNVPEFDYDGILDLLAFAPDPENPEAAFKPVIDEFTEIITLGSDALGQVDAYTYISDLGFSGYIPDSGTVYAFHDINNDGIPEMIVGTGADSGRRNTLGVFYLEGDKIGKLFDEIFYYRSGLHIGADGTVMREGSSSAFCEAMSIYSVESSFSTLSRLKYYYYDTSDDKMFSYIQKEGGVELSQADYYKAVNDYIMNGLDYSSLDWEFFVVPSGGEYDPYPKEDVVSGIYYEDVDYPLENRSQFVFNAKEKTFSLFTGLMEAWVTVSGDYTESPDGTIVCTINKRSYTETGVMNDGKYIYLSLDDGILHLDRSWGDMFIEYWDYSFSSNNDFEFVADAGTATVTGDGVRMRSGPGTNFTIMTAFDKGSQVTVTGKCGDWYQIENINQYGNTLTGFMSADYISKN